MNTAWPAGVLFRRVHVHKAACPNYRENRAPRDELPRSYAETCPHSAQVPAPFPSPLGHRADLTPPRHRRRRRKALADLAQIIRVISRDPDADLFNGFASAAAAAESLTSKK